MNRPVSYIGSASKHLDRVMEPEQFNQVIEAILDGKYSWACVLILRFAGYNPLHFIPYRTYNRLVKDNNSTQSFKKSSTEPSSQKHLEEKLPFPLSQTQPDCPSLPVIQDLAYLENYSEPSSKISGGWRSWFAG